MIINIKFLVVCYFISLFVDWVFQWQWQALNKSKWSKGDNLKKSFFAVLTHSLIYAFLTVTGTFIVIGFNNFQQIWMVLIVLFITHFFIDTRIPVKWIMRFKGLKKEEITDYQNYGFMHIGIDHRLHEIVILILALFVS